MFSSSFHYPSSFNYCFALDIWDTSDFFRGLFNVSFPLLFPFVFLISSFCFLLVSLLQAFMSCVDRQCPAFSSKCHVCMALSRCSFEGPELLSNKPCSIGETCGTNLPLLQIHSSFMRWKLIFFLKFSELPSKNLFCKQEFRV